MYHSICHDLLKIFVTKSGFRIFYPKSLFLITWDSWQNCLSTLLWSLLRSRWPRNQWISQALYSHGRERGPRINWIHHTDVLIIECLRRQEFLIRIPSLVLPAFLTRPAWYWGDGLWGLIFRILTADDCTKEKRPLRVSASNQGDPCSRTPHSVNSRKTWEANLGCSLKVW
jgi:hypothetical protein